MRQSVHLMLMYLLLSTLMPCLSAVTTTENPDSMATAGMCSSYEMIRVQKKAQIDYLYYVAGNFWHAYNDLMLELDVPFGQYVFIKYHIVMYTRGSHLVTRLMIDGKENTQFRITTGNTYYNYNSADGEVYLAKGYHTVKVQYRTPANTVAFEYPNDWCVAYLKATYHKQGKPLQLDQASKREVYKVQAEDDYYLVNKNKWFLFSNLQVVINLQSEQIVQISYHVVLETNPQCKLSLRLKIDKQINRQFNSMSGNNEIHQLSIIGRKVKLAKGVHTILLQYKTSGLRKEDADKEQQVAYLEVAYESNKKS